MRRREDDDRDRFRDRRDNNFDRMYDARQYRDDGRYRDYDPRDARDMDRDARRRSSRDYRGYDDRGYEEYEEEPRKRSFFSRSSGRRRERDNIEQIDTTSGASQLVVMTPKNFDDIKGIIDNLKQHRALIVDLCRLNDNSVQRVMDYINGAIYAIDGSIQRINPAVFLLAPTGMAISVPIDYIKEKWERNKKK